jgi:D-lyxose ketol-isomerase
MITRSEQESTRKQAVEILAKAGVVVRQGEIDQMEVADFGLSELEQSGVQIVTLVDTEKIAAKLLVLLPNQTEPEHAHPPLGDYPGKEETLRCEWGELYLYGPGEPTPNPKGHPPEHRRHTYTMWHEYILRPGDQITFSPNVPHWFQGGPEGAVVWTFSTKAVDVEDVFTDPDVRRETVIVDA